MPDKSRSDPLDARLAELARRQHGVVSRAQMLALKFGRSAVGEWVARGRLHGLHRGVYAVGHRSLTRNSHFMTAVLACGEKPR